MGEVIHDSIIEGHIVYLEEGDNTSVIIKEELNSDFIDEEYEQDENFQETSDLGRCLVCKSIEKFPNEHLDIFIQSTTASKNSAANVISTMMMKRSSADVTFNNTSICSKCFKLLNRADELQVIFQDIKRELRDIKVKFRSCLDIGNIEPDDESTNYKVKNENIKEEESLSDNKDESIEFNLDEPWENIEIASPKKTKKKKKIKRKINDENEIDQNNVKKKTKVKTGTTPQIKGHVCKICGLELRYKQTMDHHMRTAHSEDAGSTCTLCRVKFSTDLELQQHNEKCHMPVELTNQEIVSEDAFSFLVDEEYKKCIFCPSEIQFETKNDLSLHFIYKHKLYSKVQCLLCSVDIVSGINDFLKHMILYHPGQQFTRDVALLNVYINQSCDYICIECGANFEDTKSLNSHIRKHSSQLLSMVRKGKLDKTSLHCCPICGVKLNLFKLIRHINDMHTLMTVYRCSLCDMEFNKYALLRSHRYVHGIKEMPNKANKCHICFKTYDRPNFLKRHISVIHGKKREFICEICGADYAYPSHLYKHKRIHSGTTIKYRCKLCNKIYSDVRSHLKKFHKMSRKDIPSIRDPVKKHLAPYEKIIGC